MTTKPPAGVVKISDDSIERIAYQIASEIPAQEPNDNNRLGYCLWGWLQERRGTLKQMVGASGVRTKLSQEEVISHIRKRLAERGIKAS